MDWLSIALAPLLMIGAHEGGHEIEAQRQEVPFDWHGSRWQADFGGDMDKKALVSGAGFRMQDTLSQATDDLDINKYIRVASAINKLGYSAFPHGLSGGDTGGDVAMMKQAKGNNFAKAALIISALADLDKARRPERSWELFFDQSSKGTPMLKFRTEF